MDNVTELLDSRLKCIEWSKECRDYEYDIDNVYNRDKAAETIRNGIAKKQRVIVYSDVDTDGIASTYVMCEFIKKTYGISPMYAINDGRQHGLTEEMMVLINEQAEGCLLIIVDSSSSMIEQIKKLKCTVVVLDHHKLEQGIEIADLVGTTDFGYKYVIATNMVTDKPDNRIDKDMSGCMVAYSVIQRIARDTIGLAGLSDTLLSQWVGVSLLSDVISCSNNRNQFYLDKLLNNIRYPVKEKTLREIFAALNGWTFDKNFISYVFVPLINSTIRMKASEKALYCIMAKPDKIWELKEYKIKQSEIVDKIIATSGDEIEQTDNFVLLKNKSDSDFNGLIAAKLSNIYKKNAIVYDHTDGDTMCGSFRGNGQIDYIELFNRVGAKAVGHSQACGIEISKFRLELAEKLLEYTPKENRVILDLGKNRVDSEYVIDDWMKFKQLGNLYKLGEINERSSSKEEINIRIECKPEITSRQGNSYTYKIGEIDGVKGFNEITNYGEHEVYVEFTNQITMYLKS